MQKYMPLESDNVLYLRKVTKANFAPVIFGHSFPDGKLGQVCFLTTAFVLLFIISLTSWHIELSTPANIKSPHVLFPSRSKERKILFLCIFLLILANVNNSSLNVQHFCLPCVFSAALEFFSVVLEVTGNVIFWSHCSWLVFQTYEEKSCQLVHFIL